MLAIIGHHSCVYPIVGESYIFSEEKNKRKAQYQIWNDQCKKENKIVWCEKTPSHIFKISDMTKDFPDCRIIVMVRDGRDVACSLKARGYDWTENVELWIKSNEELEKYSYLPNLKVIKYETLVSSPSNTVLDILRFLNLNFMNLLNFHKTERYWYSDKIEKPDDATEKNHNINRNYQINQPIFNGSGRWKNEITQSEKDYFKQAANDWLIKLGYEEDSQW